MRNQFHYMSMKVIYWKNDNGQVINNIGNLWQWFGGIIMIWDKGRLFKRKEAKSMERTITVKGIGKISARSDYVILEMKLEAKDKQYDKVMDIATK